MGIKSFLKKIDWKSLVLNIVLAKFWKKDEVPPVIKKTPGGDF